MSAPAITPRLASLLLDAFGYREAIAGVRRDLLSHVLAGCGGNMVHAARELGMHRNTLRRQLKNAGVEPDSFRAKPETRGRRVSR